MSADRDSVAHGDDQKLYSPDAVAKLARVTLAFLRECERQELIQPTTSGAARGYAYHMVCRLIRIRHLHRDLGFDLSAIECMLRMRRQVTSLQKRLDDMERSMTAREQELIDEIQRLRRSIAHDGSWRNG